MMNTCQVQRAARLGNNPEDQDQSETAYQLSQDPLMSYSQGRHRKRTIQDPSLDPTTPKRLRATLAISQNLLKTTYDAEVDSFMAIDRVEAADCMAMDHAEEADCMAIDDDVATEAAKTTFGYAYTETPDPKKHVKKTVRFLTERNVQESLHEQMDAQQSSRSSSLGTPVCQSPREWKHAQYRGQRYKAALAHEGCFLTSSQVGIPERSLCRTLLSTEVALPHNTLFQADVFASTCQNIKGNENRVIQDISRLIFPSAEALAMYGRSGLNMLVESVNDVWDGAIPLTGHHPQPDYSVGFRREAFAWSSLLNVKPLFGNAIQGQSSFMGTSKMLFPFLACEVVCGTDGLELADRQNAHSMMIAVRGLVRLFRLIGQEGQLHRQFLAFSVSLDDSSVRIYAYYPVIHGDNDITYHRYLVRSFSFAAHGGRKRWVAYRFVRNLYDLWVPYHQERLHKALEHYEKRMSVGSSMTSEED
ncbi:hypothetical protein GGR50DRAFT_27538 [Xylaria sp. CBS 124048]|nr:hypothetical protein GGR50DRAFT_27538 [Xylaria sp. CBS 124048]